MLQSHIIDVDGAFNLIGGSGGAPEEAFGEGVGGGGLSCGRWGGCGAGGEGWKSDGREGGGTEEASEFTSGKSI